MTKEEFYALNHESILLIDIREAEELEAKPSPIPAVHMPTGKVLIEATRGTLAKDKPVIALCQTGGRCKIVTEHLNALGYQADYIEGGLNALADE